MGACIQNGATKCGMFVMALLCLATGGHPQTSSASSDASEPEGQIDREPELILDDRTQVLRQVVRDILENPDPETDPPDLRKVFNPTHKVGIALIQWGRDHRWPSQMPQLLKPWNVQFVVGANVPISNLPFLGIRVGIVDLENKNPGPFYGNVCVDVRNVGGKTEPEWGCVTYFYSAVQDETGFWVVKRSLYECNPLREP